MVANGIFSGVTSITPESINSRTLVLESITKLIGLYICSNFSELLCVTIGNAKLQNGP